MYLNDSDRGTIPSDAALPIIQDILNTFDKPVNILEVGSGNGYHTKRIAELKNIASIKATDIYDYPKKFYEIFTESSDDAVKDYDGAIDILLMISPPPNLYMDYYAIKEYELKQQLTQKYLIFVGELGAADGSEGIYQYLTNEKEKLSNWEIVSSKVYRSDRMMIDSIVRKVWYFKYNDCEL